MTKPTISSRLDEISATVEAVLLQTTATNGRVNRLDEEVFGNSSRGTRGLKADVNELETIVYDARAVLRVAKWALPLFGLSSIGTLIRVWAG